MIRAVLMAAAMLAAAAGAFAETPFHLEDPARWGTLTTVVRPDYPKEAMARAQTGIVEISGVVQGTGFRKDIEYHPDRPESAVFVAALKDLVPDWQFYPPLGDDCLPTAERIATRMHFEIGDGKPRIFAEHAKRAAPHDIGKLKIIHRVNPRYPRAGLNRRQMARVYAMLEIEPSGKVSNVKAKGFSAQAQRDREVAPFVDSSLYWLSQWEFEPLPEGEARKRLACLDIDFRISD